MAGSIVALVVLLALVATAGLLLLTVRDWASPEISGSLTARIGGIAMVFAGVSPELVGIAVLSSLLSRRRVNAPGSQRRYLLVVTLATGMYALGAGAVLTAATLSCS